VHSPPPKNGQKKTFPRKEKSKANIPKNTTAKRKKHCLRLSGSTGPASAALIPHCACSSLRRLLIFVLFYHGKGAVSTNHGLPHGRDFCRFGAKFWQVCQIVLLYTAYHVPREYRGHCTFFAEYDTVLGRVMSFPPAANAVRLGNPMDPESSTLKFWQKNGA
jgi:hypothetical protein